MEKIMRPLQMPNCIEAFWQSGGALIHSARLADALKKYAIYYEISKKFMAYQA
jgi:hypothetical protein